MIRNEKNSGCGLYCDAALQRSLWYPETGSPPAHYTPTFWVDGVDEQTGAWSDIDYTWSVYTDMINTRLAVSSPLEMSMQVELGTKADSGTVHVEVVATDTIPYTKLRLRFALVEDGLSQGSPPRNYYQALRDYFCDDLPTHLGYSITIAEGETLNWSQDFEIDPAWSLENCRMVSFVQNGRNTSPGEQEVIQAIQGPVLSSAPEEVVDLTITKEEENLVLEWSPVTTDTSGNPIEVDLYRIYRDTVPSFPPSPVPFDSTLDTFYVDNTGVVGDTLTHYYYAVTARDGDKESELSGVVGEFDLYLTVE